LPLIAIIDDSEDHREVVDYLLRDRYDVVGFDDGETALEAFRARKPDVIIMDLWLEGIDGMEVLRRIRADHALMSIPIIALTAQAMHGDRERCLAAGFNDYISKPLVQVNELLNAVGRLLP
jgi:two-component system, cell cycle response regulator DivK